ncbi:MAG: DNA replication and repair protein RecF [Chitinispirillia bacterium]|nr:DNA replication and repair protein RecF [Chitinispirillia bacterium]
MTVTFPKEGALLEGLNGAGKTNLLESIHVLCTGRSQRGASRVDMIAHGQEAAYLEGDFCYGDDDDGNDGNTDNAIAGATVAAARRLVNTAIGFSKDKKFVMKRDGADLRSYTEWFGERPVVSFGADDLELVYGSPDTRRKFLDMLISQIDRQYLDALTSYRKNMAHRNALLGGINDPALFDIYEQAMAVSASKIVSARMEIITELCVLVKDYYADISGEKESAKIEYLSKLKYDFTCISEWQNLYLNTLSDRRAKDAELMFTGAGPHRDDLRFSLDGRPAKTYASQGQCRSFALSLKLGSALLLERRRGAGMIFLVDDAVSELDPERTSRVYPLLEGRGQIFIATPKCHASIGSRVLRCAVEPGRVTVS